MASLAITEKELERFGLSIDSIRNLESSLDWVCLFREDRIEDAYATLREDGPLPEMMSHIRADPGAELEPALRKLQYMIAWLAGDRGLTGVHLPEASTGVRIAVMGGGPAGLAASVRLLEQGHSLDLFEREQRLGGSPALVYEKTRLPDPAEEIDALLAPALRTDRLSISLGADVPPESLLQSHDAVLLATGCWNEKTLDDASGIWTALQFLKTARVGQCPKVPGRVAILCGGDAAMDAAVVVKKMGATNLVLLFDVPQDEIHWHLPEAWFDTEGVHAHFDVHVTEYRVDAGGAVTGVLLKGGETVEAEMVIEAMRLYPDKVNLKAAHLFSAGAYVNGGASVEQCMREGMDAADDINQFLKERVP